MDSASTKVLRRLLDPDEMIDWITLSHKFVYEIMAGLGPATAFSSWKNPTENGEYKWCLRIDGWAQNAFKSILAEQFKDSIRIIGEETLDEKVILKGEKRPCVLVDM